MAVSIGLLHKNKAPGPDGLCVEKFKATRELIIPYLTLLFNNIYLTGEFPDGWSESIITPVHKRGAKNNPNNYRAISLTNSVSKIFMHTLKNRLRIWCDDHNIIEESQAGFRRKYSTVDKIFNLQAVIQKYLSKSKGRVYVFYTDLFKAFNSCTHTNLWNSLICKFLCIFKSMYGQLKSCVKVGDGLTRYFERNIGTT